MYSLESFLKSLLDSLAIFLIDILISLFFMYIENSGSGERFGDTLKTLTLTAWVFLMSDVETPLWSSLNYMCMCVQQVCDLLQCICVCVQKVCDLIKVHMCMYNKCIVLVLTSLCHPVALRFFPWFSLPITNDSELFSKEQSSVQPLSNSKKFFFMKHHPTDPLISLV